MDSKKKLKLIGVCCIIIIALFVVNIIRQMTAGSTSGLETTSLKSNEIDRAEAYRLLSHLEYDKGKRDALSKGIVYANEDMSGWYDTYVNAIWKMGLIEKNIKVNPTKPLTYGHCKELLDGLIIEDPKFQGVYEQLTFEFLKAEDNMLISDFIELYMGLIQLKNGETVKVREQTIFVLNQQVSEEGRDRIVSDKGLFYYQNAKDYTDLFQDESEDQSARGITADLIHSKYANKNIQVILSGQEIVLIKGINTDKYTLHNVWIEEGKDTQVKTYISGNHTILNTQYPLSKEITKVVGDITIEKEQIIQISVKPDTIQGKVLQTGKDFIEIEGYGKVTLEEDYRIYKIYGELSMEQTSSILVGYSNTDFVVSGGKISAAIIKESIQAENIRVLIKTTDHKNIYHSKVQLTSNTHFVVRSDDTETSHAAGDVITIEAGDPSLEEGRMEIRPISEEGRIQIISIERSSGNPKYRGTVEVAKGEEGLLLINELPLEEYLYAVIPSEMPTYYGLEALKVQAICARSYAYKHLMANSLNELGAHVDDSVSYQVYNNIAENEDSVLAVKDTYGKVIKYNNEVITAYYFSTSNGHTTGSEYVWGSGEATPYLKGKLLTVQESASVMGQKELAIYKDLAEEDNFKKFIMDYEYQTYDSVFNWYRWNVTIDQKELKEQIENQLLTRYKANPSLILSKVSKDGDKDSFESIEVDTVGDIVDISVQKRATGGIITELLITGTKNTVLVKTEYNIRALLAPVKDVMHRIDDTEVANLNFLPSAYFIIESTKSDGKIDNITLYGGGYGHGVGMSQNGVKSMTEAGMKYEEITAYFYEGSEIGFIYE